MRVITSAAVSKCATPIAFIIFRRPETTKKVFARIRQVKPSRLYIIADGPRTEIYGERQKVSLTRKQVELIDWPCEVIRIYSETNMGCRERVESGLDQVFEREESCIILEDDTLPHPRFFGFCSDALVLNKKRADIGCIIGTVLAPNPPWWKLSPVITRHFIPWGWATWADRWRTYRGMHVDKEQWLQGSSALGIDGLEFHFWEKQVNQLIAEGPSRNSWDYPFSLGLQQLSMSLLAPSRTLVQNIGLNLDATNCDQDHSFLRPIPASWTEFLDCDMAVPLRPDARFSKGNFEVHVCYRDPRPWYASWSKFRILLGSWKSKLGL
jgi:hypothetical protein